VKNCVFVVCRSKIVVDFLSNEIEVKVNLLLVGFGTPGYWKQGNTTYKFQVKSYINSTVVIV
jgi:hypothetical protein